MARQVASSQSADEPGRGQHGNSPERKCRAVSSSPTDQLQLGAQPGVRSVPGRGRTLGFGTGHDDYDTAVTTAPLVESASSSGALRRAAGGGDMAEVFAEDAVTTGAPLDDRRVEEIASGRSRGAGIRVVVGETTGFAHTADLSEPGLLAAARSAAAVAREGGGGCAPSPWRPLRRRARRRALRQPSPRRPS